MTVQFGSVLKRLRLTIPSSGASPLIANKVHILYPLLALVCLSVVIEVWGWDMRLADYLYRLEGSQWALKEYWVTSNLLHKGGHFLSLAMLLFVILLLGASWLIPWLTPWRRTLWFVVLAAGGGSLMVSIAKAVTHVSCPWDFSRYGGALPYASVANELLQGSGGHCFPAGHASAGYAWIALYFAGLYRGSSWRWLGLVCALVLGLAFGFAQQLRGAHFISHDLWTLAVCWFFSLTFYRLYLVSPLRESVVAPSFLESSKYVTAPGVVS